MNAENGVPALVGAIVYTYSDLLDGVPENRKKASQYHITKSDLSGQEYKAESLIGYVCKKLGIGPIGFYLFGLQKLPGPPKSVQNTAQHLWVPPNKPLECLEDRLEHYQLRIRYMPSQDGLKVINEYPDLLDFFFLQCRTDFVKDQIRISEKYEQRHILGLGVLDKQRFGNEYGLDAIALKKVKPQSFLPVNFSAKFSNILEKQRLKVNFNRKVEEPSAGRHVSEQKLNYIKAIMDYSAEYGIEEFDSEDVVVVVDPQNRGIYTRDKAKEGEKFVSTIKDVMTISVMESTQMEASRGSPYLVTISRKHEGHPQTLRFDSKEKALSFAIFIDGCHRMMEDFHGQVSADFFSPLTKQINRIKCFGPVGEDWARDKLVKKHRQQPDINYIMLQDKVSLEKYIILLIPKKSGNKVERHIIERNEDRQWFLSADGQQKSFPTLVHLLKHYREDRNGPVQLNRYVPPTEQCDPSIYLCSVNTAPTDAERLAAKSQTKQDISVIPGLDPNIYRVPNNAFRARGQYTEVMVYVRKNTDKQQLLLVKYLTDSRYLEAFMKSMSQAAFWRCPTLLTVHAVCLSPFFVLQDFGSHGDLQKFLTTRRKDIRTAHLVTTAEQVAQALLYLQEFGDETGPSVVHGNIRCKNVFVFNFEKSHGLTVKLGDSGLVEKYQQRLLRDPINEERIPWIAPEIYDSSLRQNQSVQFSDVYSFGVLLWEIFSYGERPFKQLDLREIINTVLYGEGLIPPDETPANIHHLMRRCLDKYAEQRPTAKDIVCSIRRTQTEMATYGAESVGHQYTMVNEDEVQDEPLNKPTALSENQQIDRVRELMELPLQPIQQIGDSRLNSFGSDTTVAFQDTHSTVSMSASWDSNTSLLHSQNVHHRAFDNMSVDTSHVSQDTTTTELSSRTPHFSNRPLPLPPTQNPAPFTALTNASRLAESIELDPDRVDLIGKPIGNGHYGEVYVGTYKDYTGIKRKVAVKVLLARHNKSPESEREFMEEIHMMTQLYHPNIVKLLGKTRRADHKPLMLVMEYVEKGTLRSYLINIKKEKPKQELENMTSTLLQFAREMTEAMVYLSSQKVVHRDLAARNVLVTADEHMKVSDFGLARLLDDNKDYYTMSDKNKDIPIFWCAPESLERRQFTFKSDVWSLGITLWETFTFGERPTYGFEPKYLLFYLGPNKNKRLKRDDLVACPSALYDDVMLNCWQFNPNNRPTFPELLNKIKVIEENERIRTELETQS